MRAQLSLRFTCNLDCNSFCEMWPDAARSCFVPHARPPSRLAEIDRETEFEISRQRAFEMGAVQAPSVAAHGRGFSMLDSLTSSRSCRINAVRRSREGHSFGAREGSRSEHSSSECSARTVATARVLDRAHGHYDPRCARIGGVGAAMSSDRASPAVYSTCMRGSASAR